MKKLSAITGIAIAFGIAVTTSACGGLSEQEKQMVGKYYIPAISDTHPLIELNTDRTATMRAIRPGELTYSVSGTWKISEDSLIILTDESSITIEDGDASQVGHVSPRIAYPITKYNETTLTITRNGITYDYHRRME